MKSYLPGVGITGFGVDAAHVLKEIWDREQRSGGDKRIVFGTDFSEVKTRRAEREKPGGGASSPFADAIFAVIDDLIRPGSREEDHRHALQLAVVGFSMPHGDKERIKGPLLQLPQSLREKQTLLSALVLAGEIVPADTVLESLRALLEEAKSKKRLLWDQNSWWEVDGWLELLPFSDRPMGALDVLDMIDASHRQPWRFRRVLLALAYAPSSDAEDVLIALARKEPGFLREHDWMGALERRGVTIAARAKLQFISEGGFSKVSGGDIWWLSRKLAAAMKTDGGFRADVYAEYERVAGGVESEMLEAAIAEAAENEECWRLFENMRPRAAHFLAVCREPCSMPPSATAHHRIGPARASSLESQLLDFERSCSPWLKLTRRRADWRRNASRPLMNFETNMDLPNRKPDILTSIPAGHGPWLRVPANMLEGTIANGADMFQDKFIAFVDILGFSDLVRQSEQKEEGGPSLEDCWL